MDIIKTINDRVDIFLKMNDFLIDPKFIFLGKEEMIAFKNETEPWKLYPIQNNDSSNKIVYRGIEIIEVLKSEFILIA